jgi:hypothetical protein
MTDKKILTKQVEKVSDLGDKIIENLLELMVTYQCEINDLDEPEIVLLTVIVCSSFSGYFLGGILKQMNIKDKKNAIKRILKELNSRTNGIIKEFIKSDTDE